MKSGKLNLENVVKYKRDGYNYITLFYINPNNSSKQLYEQNLEKVTFKDNEEVKDLTDRVNKEMMQIENVSKSDVEARLFVEYSSNNNGKYLITYDKTKENDEIINSIRENQRVNRIKERKELKVKETRKASRKKFIVNSLATLLVLAGIFGVIKSTTKNGKTSLELIETTSNPEYTAIVKAKPTLMPIPESLSEFAHTETVVQTNSVVQQPETVVETLRPMVYVQPVAVTDNQEEQIAVKRVRDALDEAARLNSKDGVIFNNASLYSDDAILASSKLINEDFSFLSEDDARRYEQVNQSMNVYKDRQMAYVLFGLEGAKLANDIQDPYRSQKINLVENQAREYYLNLMGVSQTKEFMENNLSYNPGMPIVQTYDENDPIGDFIVSGYINIVRSFSTQPAEHERMVEAQVELENKIRFLDTCAGEAKQR